MFSIYQNSLSKIIAAAAVLVASVSVCSAGAGDQPEVLGPVGPHEPILTTVGSKRVIAFFLPGGGHCALNAVMWDNSNADPGASPARVRVSLEPGQIVHIDTVEQKSLNLQCGENAEKLAIIDTDAAVASGIPIQQPGESVKASVSGF
jgi:hypothetical protein